jgi:hypothetical protein
MAPAAADLAPVAGIKCDVKHKAVSRAGICADLTTFLKVVKSNYTSGSEKPLQINGRKTGNYVQLHTANSLITRILLGFNFPLLP